MLVWRLCPRGRLWAALTVVFAMLGPAWAAGGVSGHEAEQSRARFRTSHGRPEGIAALAGLVRNEDFVPPAQMVEVLREMVDGKLGGPADPLVEAQSAYLLSLEEDRRGEFSAAEMRR